MECRRVPWSALRILEKTLKCAFASTDPVLINVTVQAGGQKTMGMDQSVNPPNYEVNANSIAIPFTMKMIEYFRANYELSFDQELPSSGGEVFQFVPSDDERNVRGVDGPLMGVQPRVGNRWLGIFGNGYKGTVVDAAFTTPSPDVLCVVANGAGYWLNTITREKSNVQAFPIRQVEIVGEKNAFLRFHAARVLQLRRLCVAHRFLGFR